MELTREKAIDRFEKVSDSAINSPDSCDVISLYESIKIIKEIYDSFENRSCKNCKFGMTYPYDDDIECVKIEADTQGMYFTGDFCCNKWESK